MEEHWGGGRFGADDMLSFVLNLEDQFTHRKYPARSCRQGAGPQKMLVKEEMCKCWFLGGHSFGSGPYYVALTVVCPSVLIAWLLSYPKST